MYSIYHDVFINASPKRVFEAVSEPSHLINWWPLRCSGKVDVGEEYNFYFSEEYNWYGKVCELVNDERFFISMTRSDEDWDPTTFGFVLEAHEEGTMLQFSHEDWPEKNHHFRRSSYCWAILLKGLKNYIEKDIILEFPHRS